MAGATLVIVLAIWIGASIDHVPFNPWLMAGLAAGIFVGAIVRLVRRGSVASLRGSPIFNLWLATRFVLTPALFLLGLAWVVCSVFGFAAAAVLLMALKLTATYGLAAIFITSILADLAAAIKGPRKDVPSDS